MARAVKVQVLDVAGNSLAGISVKFTGSEVLSTGADGMVMFLTVDEATATIEIGGSAVWTGPLEQLKPMEIFGQTGSGFTRK